ncbi:MAG: hypothetical protein EU535_03165 [Promethearchaeota archaeon]|nr:MAG: hypothetical protein EU535_03165 [Candidatus Lokiarchaeota archaeon]
MSKITDKDTNKDEAKIMAGFLRSGNTMLNLACPVCNNPLFRNKNNDIFCPICNKKVIVKKEDSSVSNSRVMDKSTYNEQAMSRENINYKFNLKFLLSVLEKKIDFISQKLDEETQIDLIEKYINILIKIRDLFDNLKDTNASAGI